MDRSSSATDAGLRIAMWSGPRNLSTALLRAWGSRPDTFVADEPFYAHYLAETGLEHPGRDEIIAHYGSDWQPVARWLTGPVPEGRAIFFQKHMAHHLLPHMEGAWLGRLTHAFLIRDPREMLPSLGRVLPAPRLEDTGLPQQTALYERVAARGGALPVVDARDLLAAPERILAALCRALGVSFDPAMLSWEPGLRPTDGIWARYWYDDVVNSTGFRPYRPKTEPLPEHLRPLYDAARPLYERLYERRLTA